MQTRIIDGLDGLNALRTAWEALESATFYPTQQFIWAQACASTFNGNGQLHIVVLEEAGRTIAIAPLVRYYGKSHFECLGEAELYEPTDLIYAGREALWVLASALANLGFPILLKRMSADSLVASALEKASLHRGVLISRQTDGTPWIPLNRDWVNPENHLNAGRRSDLRRAQRIAEKMGSVSSEIVTPTLLTLTPLLDEAFAVEEASWKGESKSALSLDPLRGRFYRQYAAAACRKGILRLCFLRIGGQSAAMQIAIESEGRFWLLKIGYDNHFARCSPGILLLRDTLRYAAINRLSSLEFLGTVEPWIRVWSPLERPCFTLHRYPLGMRGVTALAEDVMKSAWHKISQVRGTLHAARS